MANQKGGVGKTTTTVSLAAALAGEGVRTLVVDLDPQGNATTGLGLRAQEGAPSTYRVLVEQLGIEDAAEPTGVSGLEVLPSSLDLAGAEIELVPAFNRERRLRQAVDAVRDRYDVVLIDCPPSLGLLTINALVAADQVLVPIQCEYYALEGLGQLLRTVKLVGDSLNPELELGGVVLTMFDGRTNLAQQVVDEVRGYFGEVAYRTIIPRTVRLSEAPSYGQPIGVFDPTSRGARAYQRLARELGRRLGLELATDSQSPLDRLLGNEPAMPVADDAEATPDGTTDGVTDDLGGAVSPDEPGYEEGDSGQAARTSAEPAGGLGSIPSDLGPDLVGGPTPGRAEGPGEDEAQTEASPPEGAGSGVGQADGGAPSTPAQGARRAEPPPRDLEPPAPPSDAGSARPEPTEVAARGGSAPLEPHHDAPQGAREPESEREPDAPLSTPWRPDVRAEPATGGPGPAGPPPHEAGPPQRPQDHAKPWEARDVGDHGTDEDAGDAPEEEVVEGGEDAEAADAPNEPWRPSWQRD